MNEKGAILPSVIVFVFLLVIILLGSVKIYHNQMHQLTGTREAYKAKTMLYLTEQELMARLEKKEPITSGTAEFDVGKVSIQKTTAEHYQIKATTDAGFTLQREVTYFVEKDDLEHSAQEESEEKKETTNQILSDTNEPYKNGD